jgi:DNA-binding transcriptional LysR family regulator
MVLTEAGAEYLRHCREIVTACERATAAVQTSRETLSGTLRLAAGTMFATTFFVRNEIGFGALVPVLETWQSTPVPVYALFPRQRADNVKVRRFVDTLVAGFDEIHQKPPIYALVQQPF